MIFKNKFSKNCKSSKSCSSLPFGPTPDLSNLLQQSGACYLEIKLPSRLVVCKTRFYLFFKTLLEENCDTSFDSPMFCLLAAHKESCSRASSLQGHLAKKHKSRRSPPVRNDIYLSGENEDSYRYSQHWVLKPWIKQPRWV